jgi:hypothetical protein
VTACHLLLAFEHAGLHGARYRVRRIADPAAPGTRIEARGD